MSLWFLSIVLSNIFCMPIYIIWCSDVAGLHELFVEKGHLYLRILDSMWERAERDVNGVINIFDKYGINRDARILEIGCGNGRLIINLAKKGYKNLYGIDISPIFIEDAMEKTHIHGVSNVNFLVADARKIDEVFQDTSFDVILSFWTTLLGYYIDEDIDIDILSRCRKIAREGGYLFILNTANRDYIALLSSLGCSGPFISEYGKLVVVDAPQFDPKTSVTTSRWIFYEKRENGDLKYIDEVEIQLRFYSLHEVVGLAEKGGWKYIESYRDLQTFRHFTPSLSPLNLVFEAVDVPI